jgi:hypothetical protein
VQQAVALVADSDWAMRALMRRTIESAGFVVMESADRSQVDAALRARLVLTAHSALLVVSSLLVESASGAISTLAKERAIVGCAFPHLLFTCEFGALAEAPRPDLFECIPAGILEKPFDFAVLQGIAYRCRTFPTAIGPLAVDGR